MPGRNEMRGTDVTDMKRTYRTPKVGEFPQELLLSLQKEFDLRYGENPNQLGAAYRFQGSSLAEFTDIRLAKSGKGGLSATNFLDVTRALGILKFFQKPAVAVMKHASPSGFARQHGGNSLEEIYKLARDVDARSAFGSVVVTTAPVDKSTAEAIMSTFVEAVAAPEFEEGTLGTLERKKDIRAIVFSNLDQLPKFKGDDTKGLYDLKVMPSGRVIVQTLYLSNIRGPRDLILDPLVKKDGQRYVVDRDPTGEELENLLTAWYVNIGISSNGVVFVKDGVAVAIGSGHRERIGAVEGAVSQSYQKTLDRKKMLEEPENLSWTPGNLSWNQMRKKLGYRPLEGAVMSSDGFLPFRDSIDTIAEEGVTAIIQPGGSRRDYEIIRAVNEHHMAMAYTLERCFGH
jgi:phosphoribosylaminoimidazolecarboxamide formyltransferase/IMP cyclohydrolase